jgi:hypothetical protein
LLDFSPKYKEQNNRLKDSGQARESGGGGGFSKNVCFGGFLEEGGKEKDGKNYIIFFVDQKKIRLNMTFELF